MLWHQFNMNIYEWRKSKIIEMIFFGSVLDSLRSSEGGVLLFYKFSHCLISSRAKKKILWKGRRRGRNQGGSNHVRYENFLSRTFLLKLPAQLTKITETCLIFLIFFLRFLPLTRRIYWNSKKHSSNNR